MQIPSSEGSEVKNKMSNRIFKGDLSTEGINNIIKQLENYTDVDLPHLADVLVRRLAEVGITVAEYSVYSTFRPYIEFRYDSESLGVGELVGSDNALIHRIWYTKGGQVNGEADISPLLMSEYGAGQYALPGHRGSFPGQTHAFQSEWFWYDAGGTKHSSEEDYTMISTQPMYRALIEMMNKAVEIAKEVFSVNG